MHNLATDSRMRSASPLASLRNPRSLQVLTLSWLMVECTVALRAAVVARSPALLAFGSDSLVELISAAVVLLQWIPRAKISEARAARVSGALLLLLAVVVGALAILQQVLHLRPDVSHLGIAITLAALVIMPVLAWLKRQAAAETRNAALAADAVQSATCAYLAAVTLAGLALHAAFRIE